ncbi:MAG: hypothetical protein RIQ53_564 [Pseudomonadota bacterium]|jgi:hypothetical protein
MRFLFYLADHFDTLSSGKQLAVGLYSDLVVVLNTLPEAPPPTPESPFATDMSMLLSFSELPLGTHEGEVQVLPPGLEHRPVAEMKFKCDVTQPDAAINIPLLFRPLLLPAIGMYKVRVRIGPDEMSAEFEVRVRAVASPS